MGSTFFCAHKMYIMDMEQVEKAPSIEIAKWL